MPRKKTKREEYKVSIGPLLKAILDEQKKSINDVLHGVDDGSYWIAGEIVAKKMNGT